MAEKKTDEQKALEEQRAAEAEALAADPIGGKPPIDIAHERAAEEGEPLGYVDPKSQEHPDGYDTSLEAQAEGAAPATEQPTPKKSAASKSAVTRDDAKGDSNA